MSEWQPIETAPRDLTEVLVYCPSLGVSTAQYESRAIEPHWNYDVWDLEAHTVHRCNPTHWMPLPAPPQPRKATDE